jgi:hypothetical protein
MPLLHSYSTAGNIYRPYPRNYLAYFTSLCLILHYKPHGAEFFLRRHQLLTCSINFHYFMQPEGSLRRSLELSTGPYSVSDQPARITPLYLFKIHLNIILLPMSFLLSRLFPSSFPANILHAVLFSLFVLHALRISCPLI